ncbi:NAD(P)-dependent malic enzyme [Leucobacter sp. HY1910]
MLNHTADQAPILEDEIFAKHERGKLSLSLTYDLETKRDLSIAYTPGVAQVSRAIVADPAIAETHTWASRLVAVISDGSAVLGLGDIGPSASLPVMEGKCALFKRFADLNSIPIVLDASDVDEIVETIVRIAPSFGAVNLEDISAPRCFEIEQRLIRALEKPVMHDDQHGTAIVVLAALWNAIRVVGKELSQLRIVISGAGAAGVAVTEMLLAAGAHDIVVLDSQGILSADRADLSPHKTALAARTNPRGISGGMSMALWGADAFIGLSSAKVSTADARHMAADAIVFALSNPDPEITPAEAKAFASVIATGRSDYPNQINNVLAFPGIFRGALDAGATKISLEMKLAAAQALADLVGDDLSPEYIIPSPLDPRVMPAVAASVKAAEPQRSILA